jgi:hypothetical protein
VPAGSLSCEGVLEDIHYHGATSRWHVRTDAGPILAAVRPEGSADVKASRGDRIRLAWARENIVLLADA